MSSFKDVISKMRAAKARLHAREAQSAGASPMRDWRLCGYGVLVLIALVLCGGLGWEGVSGNWAVKCVSIGGSLIVLLFCGQTLLPLVAPVASAARTYLPLMLAMLILSFLEFWLDSKAYSSLIQPLLSEGLSEGLATGDKMFAYPNVMAPFLVAMLYGGPAALVIGLVTSAVLGVAADFNLGAFLIALCSTSVISRDAPKIGRRSHIARVAVKIGLLQFVFVFIILLRQGFSSGSPKLLLLQTILFYALLAVSVLVFAFLLLPLARRATQRVSNVTLSGYANLEQPLLRRLCLEAPGTYHHSMMVGDLAQAAAEAIGANGLLARVGAYYHDIGKLGNPHYYMENLSGGANPHDTLPPNISRIVLVNHVKEGVLLAEISHLPPVVRRFIATHHGTSIARWFLIKERKRLEERGEKAEKDDAPENYFRYPGPLPVTREETIVSLADSIEAASRAMRFFDRCKIENMVADVIKDRWADGQLAKSELSNAELAIVRKSFIATLVPLLHGRLPYPSQK